MAHSAKVLADSVSPDGVRLTTLEVCFPRIVLSEFNTHRVFSRNSASSRAIPVEKMIKMAQDDPYIPTHWGKNQKGMQAEVELTIEEQREAEMQWLTARNFAVKMARELLNIGVHKQITNRLLEPFMWHTVIVTATEWSNFWNLRRNPMAHPEIKLAADLMRDAIEHSSPHGLNYGDWHLPLVSAPEDFDTQILADPTHPTLVMERLCKVSVGRCARVSYLTHDGKRDPQADIELADRLLAAGHMSPFEHVARPMTQHDLGYCVNGGAFDGSFSPGNVFCGNFRGWLQFRKTIPHEADILGTREVIDEALARS